jgi:hypothetical protein
MDKFDPLKDRRKAKEFALKVYQATRFSRHYALTNEATMMLTVLAAAMAQHRKSYDVKADDLYDSESFQKLINQLAAAGCNVLQQRRTDPKPLPKPWTNPVTGQPLPPPKSLDERAILAKHDPDLLNWYDELEKHPYKTLADHLAAEAARNALASIPYDEQYHKMNPFLGKDETAKNLAMKKDPETAKFYQAEAKPVEIPLFGKNRNLTIAGRLTKDPFSNAVVTVAEKIHEAWKADDRSTAIAQRKAAEDTLAKLEAS